MLFPNVPNSRTPHLSSLPHTGHILFFGVPFRLHTSISTVFVIHFSRKKLRETALVSHVTKLSRVESPCTNNIFHHSPPQQDEDAPVVATNTLRGRPRLPRIDTEMWFNCPLRLFLDTSCSFAHQLSLHYTTVSRPHSRCRTASAQQTRGINHVAQEPHACAASRGAGRELHRLAGPLAELGQPRGRGEKLR